MTISGTLSHIDISVGYPERSIPFYAAFLEGLGYRRMAMDLPGFVETNPTRAWWALEYPGGGHFGIEVRPAKSDRRDKRYDRYQPGPHHLAFHAASRDVVDALYQGMIQIGANVLDPPTDYSGQPGYSDGYYAVFVADPDNVKLEVVYTPGGQAA